MVLKLGGGACEGPKKKVDGCCGGGGGVDRTGQRDELYCRVEEGFPFANVWGSGKRVQKKKGRISGGVKSFQIHSQGRRKKLSKG